MARLLGGTNFFGPMVVSLNGGIILYKIFGADVIPSTYSLRRGQLGSKLFKNCEEVLVLIFWSRVWMYEKIIVKILPLILYLLPLRKAKW